MGFFSWRCPVSDLPIMARTADLWDLSHVVVVHPDDTRDEGSYDGYGRVQLPDRVLELEREPVRDATGELLDYRPVDRLVIHWFFDPARHTYASLPPNQPDPGQGYFHDPIRLNRVVQQTKRKAARW